MTSVVAKEAAARIAELENSDSWAVADFLVVEFPVAEYGEGATSEQTGLYAALEDVSDELRRVHGIERGLHTLRMTRRTAIKFPPARRLAGVAFEVHRTVRNEAELQKWQRQAAAEGFALTSRMVGRFRADEKRAKEGPKPRPPAEERMRKRIKTAAIAVYLGSVKVERDDWWNAQGFTPEKRTDLIRVLRVLADDIKHGGQT